MFRMTIPLVFILSANAYAQTEVISDETVEAYRCDFEAEADANYDLWPDGWTRRRGRGYPTYVKVEIADDEPASGNRCLRMDLDGGAVTLYSPLIEVSPLFSYSLSGFLRTSGLVHNWPSMEVIFYDADRRQVESFKKSPESRQEEWQELLIGPVTAQHQNVRWAAIALHLTPSERADLRGTVWFDALSFGRLPRMSLATNKDHNIYEPDETVEIRCRLSGYTGYEPRLRFELLSVDGRVLDSHEGTLHAISEPNSQATSSRTTTGDEPEGGFLGDSSWQPPIRENGFYQVRVSVHEHRGLTRTVNLIVADQMKRPHHGEFGWSLPDGDANLSLTELASLLGKAGVNWLKFPMWFHDDRRAEKLAWFAERVSLDDIEIVGILNQPPPHIHELIGDGGKMAAASIFEDPAVWNQAIDAVMTRLSLKVRWWQIGDDEDISFISYPELEDKLTEIRKGFNRFGREINLGTTWRFIDETPVFKYPPLTYLSFTADPDLTDNELRKNLASNQNGQMQRWIMLAPLHRDKYDLETRAHDLVKRMLAAKMGQADAIFVPRPFDPDRGLMKPDGTPGPLLLPWRLTAELLAGANYLGTMKLPNGSENYVFERDGDAVMVVWNPQQTEEVLYLGENVQQIDLWGRKTTPDVVTEREGFKRHKLQVDTMPTFLTGVNPLIAKWRMSVEFDTKKLESVFGQRQFAEFHFGNTFRQGVGGHVTVITPPVWIIDSPKQQFKLAAGEVLDQRLGILLGTNANSGPQKVRLDFHLTADRKYQFSVYREIQVGLGDIEIEVESHLDEFGQLVVEQHLTNRTAQEVSFNCLLFVPGRRRERRQVFDLARGRQTIRFVIANGEELVGQTLGLRAEEVNGARVLNHRIVAQE